MGNKWLDAFCWVDREMLQEEGLSAEEQYRKLVSWAGNARGKNPDAFDAVTLWLLDDSEWSGEKLAVNERILMQDIIGNLKKQTVWLQVSLTALKASGVVNEAVFPALERFMDELTGKPHEARLQEAVTRMFADFSIMLDHEIRKQIAGGKTGSAGVDTVDWFGYINFLKDCDAAVQWALFMPEIVKQQQTGFKVKSFEYKKMSALRFVGKEATGLETAEARKQIFMVLDAMPEYESDFSYDVLLIHHYGRGVDIEQPHLFRGRFMKADAPVPEGFIFFDFTPAREGEAGTPYIAQFAYAVFEGDEEAMHKREGYDSDAMYDVTRNIMLAEGVLIPYPDKYWVAEVFLEGHEKNSSAYMFSAEL